MCWDSRAEWPSRANSARTQVRITESCRGKKGYGIERIGHELGSLQSRLRDYALTHESHSRLLDPGAFLGSNPKNSLAGSAQGASWPLRDVNLRAMLHALLHGKLGESNPEPQRLEDALTSTVFGAIFWAEDWNLLEKWLRIPPSSAQRTPTIEYWFWPRLNEAEPDVVFRLGNALVVVEAKYRSDRHDKAAKAGEDESIGDQLVRQYRSVTRQVPERAQYVEAIEYAISECHLVQIYVVDAGRQRARREIEESKLRLPPNATLNLVTWQSLSRVLNVNSAVNQGWRSDLAKYLRLCGLDIFDGFSRWRPIESVLPIPRLEYGNSVPKVAVSECL